MGSALNDDLVCDFFGNEEQRQIFEGRSRLQSWLDVEAALAQVQAGLDLVPAEAAEKIATACDAERYDLAQLRDEINSTQHPIVPVVHALEEKVGPEAARFVHFGATTQDIMDTGVALQLKRSLQAIRRDLAAATDATAVLAAEHRETTQAGRTHAQHAVPITFGLKAATWLQEMDRTLERIEQAEPRLLAVQIFGAAGTMAAYGDRALEVKAGVADRLGLFDTETPWHAARDRVSELAAVMSGLAGAAERIAGEVVRLQSTELGEVTEPLVPGHIGSSTMPQKRNPHLSEGLIAKARMVHGAATTLMRNSTHLHERDMSAWALEWLAVPELMIMSGAIAADLKFLLSGLSVNAETMAANLTLTGGQIVAEGLMMRLDAAIGRDRAHHLLVELTRAADQQGRSFAEVAASDERVASHLSASEIEQALDPASYTGKAAAIVDQAIARHSAETAS